MAIDIEQVAEYALKGIDHVQAEWFPLEQAKAQYLTAMALARIASILESSAQPAAELEATDADAG